MSCHRKDGGLWGPPQGTHLIVMSFEDKALQVKLF